MPHYLIKNFLLKGKNEKHRNSFKRQDNGLLVYFLRIVTFTKELMIMGFLANMISLALIVTRFPRYF